MYKNMGQIHVFYTETDYSSIQGKIKSSVCLGFFYASKDFDRINHWNLFAKLIKCNAHYKIINLYIGMNNKLAL